MRFACFYDKHENWLGCCIGDSNWLDISAGYRNWLDLIVGMKWIWFLSGWSKMTSFQCGGSAFTWFLWSGRQRLVFSVRIEINWFFLLGHRNRLDTRVEIKIDLISVMGSKLTRFYVRGRIWLVFCAGVKIDPFLCAGRILVGCSLWIELDGVFERGAKNIVLLCEHENWIVFGVGGSNGLGFSVRCRNWLGSCEEWNPFGCCVGYRE